MKYVANHISIRNRIAYLIFSIFLISYGISGLISDDLYLPFKRVAGGKSHGYHFHGSLLWLLFLATICFALNLLSIIFDHYDKRNNENKYKIFAKTTFILGFTIVLLSIVLDVFFY